MAEQYGGHFTPDFRSGKFTCNGVTVNVSFGGASSLTKEQVAAMVQRIQRALRQKRDN